MKQEDRDFIDHLKNIHYKCRDFLIEKDFEGLEEYLNTFTIDSDIGELKTILVITKSTSGSELLKGYEHLRERIYGFYETKKNKKII